MLFRGMAVPFPVLLLLFHKQTNHGTFHPRHRPLKYPKIVAPLMHLPESDMNYQLGKFFLSNGKILREHKVFNSSIVIVESNEDV